MRLFFTYNFQKIITNKPLVFYETNCVLKDVTEISQISLFRSRLHRFLIYPKNYLFDRNIRNFFVSDFDNSLKCFENYISRVLLTLWSKTVSWLLYLDANQRSKSVAISFWKNAIRIETQFCNLPYLFFNVWSFMKMKSHEISMFFD